MRRMRAQWMGVVGLCLALTSGCRSSSAHDGGVTDGGVTDSGQHDGGGVPDGGATDGGVTDGGADAGPEPYTSFEAFDRDATGALCDLKVRCGQFADALQCESSVGELLAAQGKPPMTAVALQRALDDGRVRLDGAAAAGCVAQLHAASCTSPLAPADGACIQALAGQVAVAQGCFGDFECGATGYCDVAGRCPGTCLLRKGEGEFAGRTEECMPGLYFASSGQCTRFVPIGGACPVTFGGIGFGDRPWCTPEAYCDEATDICRPRGELGADCETSSQCHAVLTCTAGKCSSLTPRGGACDYYFAGACQADLQCTASEYAMEGTCEVRGASGAACFRDDQCQAGLLCQGVRTDESPPGAGACRAPLAVGEACDVYQPQFCGDAAYCSSETNTCLPRHAVGEACTEYASCEAGAACSAEGLCAYFVCEDRTP